jgi:hypothetical protein
MAADVEHVFNCLLASEYPVVSKMAVCVSCHFTPELLFLSVSFERYSYVADTSPLSGMNFAQTFSPCIVCLFSLLTGSFEKQTFLILMRFDL